MFGDGWSSVYELEPGERELVVGREDDCTIRVDERSVSRRHAALVLGPPTTKTFVDVRYIAATSRDVEKLVEGGELRADLVCRLAGVTVYVPALRDRPSATLPLARRLLAWVPGGRAALSKQAERALVAHSWPGNVRELKAALHRASIHSGDKTIETSHLALGALRFGARKDAMTEPRHGRDRRAAHVPEHVARAEASSDAHCRVLEMAVGMFPSAVVAQGDA